MKGPDSHAKALREFRELNARVLEDAYVLLHEINLGIAVDTPQGLLVPVVEACERLSVAQIGEVIAHLAERARSRSMVDRWLARGRPLAG